MVVSSWLIYLVTVQALGVAVVFFLLSRYNHTHAKRFKEAARAWSKPSSGLFQRIEQQGINPFENTTWRLTEYEVIKMSFMSVTIFPIRVGLAATILLGASLVAYMMMKHGRKDLARATIQNAARCFLFVMGYYYISVKGKQEEGIGAIVSSHHTFFDGIVYQAISNTRVFADRCNFENPVIKVFADALDIVLFDRSGQESRLEARRIMSAAATNASEGLSMPILVFPAGSISNTRCLVSFKDGAFAPGVAVQPAVIRYFYKHCDLTWSYTGPHVPMLLLRCMCQFINHVEVEFLPVYRPSEEERLHPRKFAQNVQVLMAKALNVPIVHHCLEDVQFSLAATKAKLPPETGIIGFNDLRENYSVDPKTVKRQLHVFKQMDPQGTGLVTFDEFRNCFRRAFHDPSPNQEGLLRHFFDLVSGGGTTMDFRCFLVGLALVAPNEVPRSPSRQTLHVADTTRAGTPDKTHRDDEHAARGRCTSPAMALQQAKDKHREEIYAQLAFAAFAEEHDDRITWREFADLWGWLYPADPNPAPATAHVKLPEGWSTHRLPDSGLVYYRNSSTLEVTWDRPVDPDASDAEPKSGPPDDARGAEASTNSGSRVATPQTSESAPSAPSFTPEASRKSFLVSPGEANNKSGPTTPYPTCTKSEDHGRQQSFHKCMRCESSKGCSKSFYFGSRHHCRQCGNSVCDRHFVRPRCEDCHIASRDNARGEQEVASEPTSPLQETASVPSTSVEAESVAAAAKDPEEARALPDLRDEELSLCAKRIFDDIVGADDDDDVSARGGAAQGEPVVRFQDFMAYAERYPTFEKRLRKAFFDQMAAAHAPA